MRDKIKVDERGRAFGTHWAEAKCLVFGKETFWKEIICNTST
jgi:hypothetical protein